jgi:hypothetical protein
MQVRMRPQFSQHPYIRNDDQQQSKWQYMQVLVVLHVQADSVLASANQHRAEQDAATSGHCTFQLLFVPKVPTANSELAAVQTWH